MPDPRDELIDCARAVAGLRDLVSDISRTEGRGFDSTGAAELAVLLDMVERRLTPAVQAIQDLVPRGHSCAD